MVQTLWRRKAPAPGAVPEQAAGSRGPPGPSHGPGRRTGYSVGGGGAARGAGTRHRGHPESPVGPRGDSMTESRPDTRDAGTATEPGIRVLFTREQIAARVREMGLEIARDLGSHAPVFVGVLKG